MVQQHLEWRRAHWLAPLTRMWVLVLVFVFTIGRQLLENTLTGQWEEAPSPEELPADTGFLFDFVRLLGPWLLLGLIFGLGLASYYLVWFFTRFAVDDQAVHVRSGIFFKSYRKANLDKIQSVDIVHPLLPRLLGLAEVRVETAGAGESTLAIKYLKAADAAKLRSAVLALTLEAQDESGQVELATALVQEESSPTADLEQRDSSQVQISGLPLGRLLASRLLTTPTLLLLLGVILGLSIFSWVMGGFWQAIVANFVLLTSIFAGLLASLNRDYNFSLFHSPQGLKMRYGFTETASQTVPTGRIQALEIIQPLLWRYFGWYTVQANIAGYGILPSASQQTSGKRTVLLPVATQEQLQRLLPLVIADHQEGGLRAGQLEAALKGQGSQQGFTANPRSSRYLDWFSYRRKGFAVTDKFLLIRSGAFTYRLKVIPHDKVQSCALQAGPLQRKLGLATVSFHSVPGPVLPELSHLEQDQALALLARY